MKCSADRAGIGLTLRDFWKAAVSRVNGERYPFLVTFGGAGGLHAEYYIRLPYDAGENEWNTDGYDIPLSFLSAFAKGDFMRLDRSKNAPEEIATYPLDGSAMVTVVMRKALLGTVG